MQITGPSSVIYDLIAYMVMGMFLAGFIYLVAWIDGSIIEPRLRSPERAQRDAEAKHKVHNPPQDK